MSASIRQSSPIALCCLFLLLTIAVWLRWDTFARTYFADELIPVAVVKHMQATKTLDTNWENADWRGDYAGGFYKLKQYNFSSYHTVLLGFRQLANAVGLDSLPDLVLYRATSVLFQLFAIVLVFLVAVRLAGVGSGILAAAFLALMPQAVIDGHYARPESFVIFLVALSVWLAVRANVSRDIKFAYFEAVVWGVAFACKFSFLPMILLAFLVNAYRFRSGVVSLVWLMMFVVGIWLSAPYILLDSKGFFHGVSLLLKQYSSAKYDSHYLINFFPSALQLFPYITVFFSLPVLFLLAISFLYKSSVGRFFAWIGILISVFYLFIFSSQGVFFERNLSHLLPIWSVLFVLGFNVAFGFFYRKWMSVIFAVLFLLWPTFLSFQVASQSFRGLDTVRKTVSDFERQSFHSLKVVSYQMMGGMHLEKMTDKEVLRVPKHKLEGMGQLYGFLQAEGFEKVGDLDLPLAYLPYNQLQINQFPPGYIYYIKNISAAEGLAQ